LTLSTPTNSLQAVYGLLDTVHQYDIIVDGEGVIIHFGPLMFEDVPVIESGKALFDVFQSVQHSRFDALFESIVSDKHSDVFSVVNSNNLRYEIRLSLFGENMVYLHCVPMRTSDVAIVSHVINSIDPALSPDQFILDVMHHLPFDVGIFDRNGRYLYINPAGIKNDSTRNFIIGKTDYDYCDLKGIDRATVEPRMKNFRRVIETKQPTEWVDEHPKLDAESVFVLRRYHPVVNRNGEVSYVIGYGIDISVERNSEIKLQQKQKDLERLTFFLDNAVDGIQVLNERGEFAYLNKTARERLGIDDNFNAHTIYEIESFFESSEDWLNHLNELKEKGHFSIDTQHKNVKTGGKTPVHVEVIPTNFEGENFVLTMATDIRERIAFIKEIELANQRFADINEKLEISIAEKTSRNDELTERLANQDKLAMIGEITAGITHDLNTPIGAVKIGAESIRYSLENLFKSVIEKCTFEQLHYSCSRAVESNVKMFIGGLQVMRETKAFNEVLQQRYPDRTDLDSLASAFVKARILADEDTVIDYVMSGNNPMELLDLMYHIQSIRTFVDTVMEAGEKAASVIRNLRFYLKEGANLSKEHVNLHENIRTVLNVFNHQLKHGIDLNFEVPEDLEIIGYESKLYQLWSNLIKNAVDAIGSKGELIITGWKENGHLMVEIKNSGKMIPYEIRDKIFEKFFTTKAENNGTGLGLSIVSKVIEDHGAQIKLNSDEHYTSFLVTFTTI
jgi:signal transduction histidine kinase